MKYFYRIVCLIIMCFSFMSFVSAREIKKTVVAEVNNAIFVNIIETSDRGYFGVGYNLPDSKYAIPAQYAVKLDKNGKVEWEYRDDYIFSALVHVQETNDNGFVVVGSLGDPSSCNIIKFDKEGNVEWENKRCVASDSVQYVSGSSYSNVLVDGSDIIAVGSTSYNSSGTSFSGGFIAKFDNDGNVLWKKEAPTAATGYSNIVKISDGSYLAIGSIRKTNTCIYMVNYSKDGNVISEKTQCEDGKDVSLINIYDYDGKTYFVIRVGGKSYNFEYSVGTSTTSTTKKIGGDYYYIPYDNGLKYDEKIKLIGNDTKEAEFGFRRDFAFYFDYLLNDYYLGNDTYYFDIYTFNVDLAFYDYEKNLLLEDSIKVSSMVENKDDDSLLASSILYNEEATKNSEIYKSKILLYELMYDVEKNDSNNGAFDVEQNSNLGKITVTPDVGYVLGSITIVDSNGNNIDYYEEDGYYYFEMNDDVTVNVTYKVDELKNTVNNTDKEENPETNDISSLMILVLVVALVIYYCSYTGIKKKSI